MFLSPPQRVVKHSLVGRILLCLPVTIYFVILGVISLDPEPVPMLAWIIGAAALALTVWGCIAIGKNQVSVHTDGVQQDGPFGSQGIRWQDVTETRYRRTPAVNAGAHFGLLGWLIYSLVSRGNTGDGGQESLAVVSSDGAKVKISSNYKGAEFAIGDVFRAVNPRLLEDARRRVRQGDTVKFGDVGISSAGVSWKGKPPVPYAEITSLELEGPNLKVKQQGKWMAPVSVAAQKVPNVFVALDLMKELKYGANQPQPAFLQAAQVKT